MPGTPPQKHLSQSSFFVVFRWVAMLLFWTCIGSQARAQMIAWGEPHGISGDADISRAGFPVDAIQAYAGADVQGTGKPPTTLKLGDTVFQVMKKDGESYSAGKISLAGGTRLQFTSGNVRSPEQTESFYNALPTAPGVSADYSTLVSNGAFFEAGPWGAIRFQRLTSGRIYQVQLWALVQNHSRTVVNFGDAAGHTVALDAEANIPKHGPLPTGQPCGQTVLGIFRADSPQAIIDWFAGTGTNQPFLSAVALRDVTDVPGMRDKIAAVRPPGPVQPVDNPPGVPPSRAWKDLTYQRVGRHNLQLDLFMPRNAPRSVSLVVYIHGGAFRSLDRTEGFANGLIDKGFALATVDYRLTNESPFPAQIEDCQAAVRWLRAHATEYGYAAEKIGVIGDSAGGHLAALMGVSDDPASRVQGVVDYFGSTNLLALNNRQLKDPLEAFLGGPLEQNQAKARQASPIFHVSTRSCPFLIVHGSNDEIIPLQQSEELFKALQNARVPSEFYVMPGAGHGANNPQAFEKTVAFFKKYLR